MTLHIQILNRAGDALSGGGGGGQVGSRRPAMDGTTGKEQRTLVKFDQSNHTHHHHAPRKFR